MRSSIVVLFSFLLFIHEISFGCVGAANQFDIDFAEDSSEVGSLVVKRSINGKQKEELQDDTGYISAYLAQVNLVKSAKNESISNTNEVVRFLRLRLKKLKDSLKNEGTASQSIGAVDELDKLLNQTTIDPKELSAKWSSLESSLRQDKIFINAKYRNPGSSKWSETEDSFSKFEVPSTAVSRSAGCSSEISSFNVKSAGSSSGASNSGSLPRLKYGGEVK